MLKLIIRYLSIVLITTHNILNNLQDINIHKIRYHYNQLKTIIFGYLYFKINLYYNSINKIKNIHLKY